MLTDMNLSKELMVDFKKTAGYKAIEGS